MLYDSTNMPGWFGGDETIGIVMVSVVYSFRDFNMCQAAQSSSTTTTKMVRVMQLNRKSGISVDANVGAVRAFDGRLVSAVDVIVRAQAKVFGLDVRRKSLHRRWVDLVVVYATLKYHIQLI